MIKYQTISKYILLLLLPIFLLLSLSVGGQDVNLSGDNVSINGIQLSIPWKRWQQEKAINLGISDTAAFHVGLELLNNNNYSQQPIDWFDYDQPLPTKFIGAIRYINISDILQSINANITTQGNKLKINLPIVKIQSISIDSNESTIITLDKPTLWQVTKTDDESIITIPSDYVASNNSSNYTVESLGNNLVNIRIPSNNIKVESIANPYRLILKRQYSNTPQQIKWTEGILWGKDVINGFPVTWLEIDPKNSNIQLKPFTSNPTTVQGISPLIKMAQGVKALGAINAGFFNRNNQLPLGAIRIEGKWLSGPILNRGVVAWDNQASFSINALTLQETLVTTTGESLGLLNLNSGYVQQGIARYTRDWGERYTPLTDNETVVVVKSDRIVQELPGGMAQQNSFAIPQDGFLLIRRGNTFYNLSVGNKVDIQTKMIPEELTRYPNIVGAGPLLWQKGQFVLNPDQEKFSTAFSKQAASRSAIAINTQGKVIIAAVHRQPKGSGPTLMEWAQVLAKLNVVDALNLDGGSSTSLYLGGQLIDRPPNTAARVHNGIGIFLNSSPN